MEEGKAMGAKDFFIGGDLNIELKVEVGARILMVSTVLTGMAFVGLNAVDVARTRSLTLKNTLVDANDLGECHTWLAFGSRVRKKHKDCIMGLAIFSPRRENMRPFPVVVKIDGKELRVKVRKKGRLDSQI